MISTYMEMASTDRFIGHGSIFITTILLKVILTITLLVPVSFAQTDIVVTPIPYLDLNMCRSALRSCDTADGNGGIGRINGEFYCFVRTLGERKCNLGRGAITGRQDLTFVDVVCNEIPTIRCRLSSELPIAQLTNDSPQSNAMLATICTRVDATIEPRPCPPPTTRAPVLTPPTRSPSVRPTLPTSDNPTVIPTIQPTGTAPPIAQNFTLENCQEDLATASADDAIDDPTGETLTYDEYVKFLYLVGQRGCFTPSDNFEIATNATFNQHRCLSHVRCIDTTTVNMTALNLREFCRRSFYFALSAPLCDAPTQTPTMSSQPTQTPSTAQPAAQPVPMPTTEQPQLKSTPTTPAPSPAPVTSAPSRSMAPTVFNITIQGSSSVKATTITGVVSTILLMALLLFDQ